MGRKRNRNLALSNNSINKDQRDTKKPTTKGEEHNPWMVQPVRTIIYKSYFLFLSEDLTLYRKSLMNNIC